MPDITLRWTETVQYKSTVKLSEEDAAALTDDTLDEWVWFEQCDTIADFFAVDERSITSWHVDG